jgi:hypothetical protein
VPAPIDSGLRRKWFILSVLGLAGFAALGLASEVGLQEANLPNDVRFDELRLLEPQRYNDATVNEAANGFETAETRLRALNQCFEVNVSDGGISCTSILLGLLRDNPANGRLWLEMARMRSREAKGLDDDALNALQNSFDYAPREGWIRRVRANFVLSVWQGLTPELQRAATADILEAIGDDKFVVYLSHIYETSPLSRIAISEVMIKAPTKTQRSFLHELQHQLQN